MPQTESTPVSIERFQRWVVGSIVACVLLYVGFSVWSGFEQIEDQLHIFDWSMFVVIRHILHSLRALHVDLLFNLTT